MLKVWAKKNRATNFHVSIPNLCPYIRIAHSSLWSAGLTKSSLKGDEAMWPVIYYRNCQKKDSVQCAQPSTFS